MNFDEALRHLADDPEQIEKLYQQAVGEGDVESFSTAIDAAFAGSPDDRLLAAWHFRLASAPDGGVGTNGGSIIAWQWALAFGLLNALLLWVLSDDKRFMITVREPYTGYELNLIPVVLLLAAPISAVAISLFLEAASNRKWTRVAAVSAFLAAVASYVLLVFRQTGPRVYQEQYLTLMVMHLGLLAWAAAGVVASGWRSDADNRFAFIHKSFEAVVVGGLFAIGGGVFTAITFGLFQALGIEPPDWVIRLFVAGGAGLLAVVAVAVVYDPRREPMRQSFTDGLSRLIALLMRLLLPATLAVLVLYTAFIPVNFREPFENRDVLVIYNAMLFAVMALLIGATPVRAADLELRLRRWLRRGIVALAALALLVSVYALAAIVYRASIDRLTPNRLTFIGWNVVNMAILAWLIARQLRADRETWLPSAHATFAVGALPYVGWALVTALAIPWLFGINQGDVAALPERVQQIVVGSPYPILLRCASSPHIYLLDEGEKRWIEDIPTFEHQGYSWDDVHLIDCADVDAIPDGPPIPEDAGVPPTVTPGQVRRTPTPLPRDGYPSPSRPILPTSARGG